MQAAQARLLAYGAAHGYAERRPYQPFHVSLRLLQPVAGFANLHLDGPLQAAVVQEALQGERLPPSAERYEIPLPLETRWTSVTGVPLYHTSNFAPAAQALARTFWHIKHNNHDRLARVTRRKSDGTVWQPDDGSGAYKEYRLALPTQQTTTLIAWGVGLPEEVARLLRLLEPHGLGKKTAYGLGQFVLEAVTPLDHLPAPLAFLAGKGDTFTVLRPLPLSACPALGLEPVADAAPAQLAYSPPYWLPANQALCLEEGSLVRKVKPRPMSPLFQDEPLGLADHLLLADRAEWVRQIAAAGTSSTGAMTGVENLVLTHPKLRHGQGIGARCALSGLPIRETGAVAAKDALSSNMGNVVDFLKAPDSPWVSNAAALVMGDPKKWHRNFVALVQGNEGRMFWPTFAVDEKQPGQARPVWRETLVELADHFQGWQIVAVCKDEVKSRAWPRARIGVVGRQTPLYFAESKLGMAGLLLVDIHDLKRLLLRLEALLDAGYGKMMLKNGVPVLEGKTLKETLELERELAAWRDRPEFPLAWRAAHTLELRTARALGAWPESKKKGPQHDELLDREA